MVVQEGTPIVAPDSRARLVNACLGVWLFISAFLWPHSEAQRTNTWILGVLAVIFSLAAMRVPRMRYLNTALSIWLFISTWALLRVSTGTLWNNVLVAIAIFVLSLVPSEAAHPSGVQRPRRPSHA